MRRIETDVLVIGGGATGLGVVRDAALRGWGSVLVERGDLGEGTTGHFHGLLHSGGRYVVSDPQSAAECAAENAVLRRIAADTIEDTGGLFVSTPWDDPGYADRFLAGCRAAGVTVAELTPAEALAREPRLNPGIRRAFLVPDAAIDAWKLLWACAASAAEHGAQVLPYHDVRAVRRDGDRVAGALVRDVRGGEDVEIGARVTVNATGAWAGQLAALAGCDSIRVVAGRGIMVAMNHRLVNTVVNRCELPSDGDILVPIGTVSVIGTTDTEAPDVDRLEIDSAEVQQMLDAGEKLVPGFRSARALRVWVGARPLFPRDDGAVTDTHTITRGHTVIDHRVRDGVAGFVSITGGKVTTFRLMAEDTVDAVEQQLGEARPCRTAEEPLPGSEAGSTYRLGSRVRRHERRLRDEQLVCECELVERGWVEDAFERLGTTRLDDVRRTLRLGMGPCQGGFCIYRATGILHAVERLEVGEANGSLRDFLQERWKGVQPVLYGDQLRQARLDDWIFHGVLGVGQLPP